MSEDPLVFRFTRPRPGAAVMISATRSRRSAFSSTLRHSLTSTPAAAMDSSLDRGRLSMLGATSPGSCGLS